MTGWTWASWKPGRSVRPRELDDARPRPDERPEVVRPADGDDPPARDGDGLGRPRAASIVSTRPPVRTRSAADGTRRGRGTGVVNAGGSIDSGADPIIPAGTRATRGATGGPRRRVGGAARDRWPAASSGDEPEIVDLRALLERPGPGLHR